MDQRCLETVCKLFHHTRVMRGGHSFFFLNNVGAILIFPLWKLILVKLLDLDYLKACCIQTVIALGCAVNDHGFVLGV